MRAAAGLILISLILARANAQMLQDNTGATRTIQALYENCKSPETVQQLICMSYLSGFSSMMTIVATVSMDDKTPPEKQEVLKIFGLCNPDFVSNGQLRQVFINWAEKHPEQWQQEQSLGAWSALHEAWPCR